MHTISIISLTSNNSVILLTTLFRCERSLESAYYYADEATSLLVPVAFGISEVVGNESIKAFDALEYYINQSACLSDSCTWRHSYIHSDVMHLTYLSSAILNWIFTKFSNKQYIIKGVKMLNAKNIQF